MLLLLLITIGRKGERGNGEGKGKTRKAIHVLDNSQKDEKRMSPLPWDSVPCMREYTAFVVSQQSLISPPVDQHLLFIHVIHSSSLPHSFTLILRADLHSIHQVT